MVPGSSRARSSSAARANGAFPFVNQLVAKVREINKAGTAVLVVEQSINVALEVAERAVFLEHGQVRFRGRADQLLNHPEVLRAVFLGGVPEHQHKVESGGRPPRGVVVTARAACGG